MLNIASVPNASLHDDLEAMIDLNGLSKAGVGMTGTLEAKEHKQNSASSRGSICGVLIGGILN